MKKILLSVLAAFFLASTAFAYEEPPVEGPLTLGHALNLATRQRMLSQRAAKAFALCTQQIDAALNEEQLMGSISAFDLNQTRLATFAPTFELKNKIQKVSDLWASYKQLLTKDRDKINLMDVVQDNQRLFLACDDVVKAMNDYAVLQPEFNPNFKLGKSRNVIDAAARVRSLSQRMTFYSAVLHSGLPFTQSKEYLEAAHADFRAQLGSVMLFSENTPAIKADIAEIVAIWEKYGSSPKMLAGEYNLTKMSEDFNKVVSLVDNVVLAYESLLESTVQSAKN